MSMNEFVRGVGAVTADAGIAAMTTKMGGKGLAAGIRTGATGVMSARNGAMSAAARGFGKGTMVKAAFGNVGSDIGSRVKDSFTKHFGASEYQRNRAKQIDGVAALRDNKNNPNGAHQAKLKAASAKNGTGNGGGGGSNSGGGSGGGSGASSEKKPEIAEV